jgi:hypothetical protein
METKFNVIRPTLRFTVGDRVKCHMSPYPDNWEMATVVMQWHTRHPYLTRLDSGINVSAAHDTDDFNQTPLTPAERQCRQQDFHNAEVDTARPKRWTTMKRLPVTTMVVRMINNQLGGRRIYNTARTFLMPLSHLRQHQLEKRQRWR